MKEKLTKLFKMLNKTKKVWIPIVASLVVFAVLLIVLLGGGSKSQSNDGNTENPSAEDEKGEESSFNTLRGIILEMTETTVLIEPLDFIWNSTESEGIIFDITGLKNIGADVGSIVEVTYEGKITEDSFEIGNVKSWKLSMDKRPFNYMNNWIDKTVVEKTNSYMFSEIVIEEIYANCFFATSYELPYCMIKVNGGLSNDWCVGDRVICTYENLYYDEENYQAECDLRTIKPIGDIPIVYKPVIYLYPIEETDVSVLLDCDGRLTCTYPKYQNGWNVTARPDGTLIDKDGQTYNYLYWEGELNARYDFSKGFCVKGEYTAEFLEIALAKLGLTRREANEFIVFWLPMMQDNEYNIISFQGDAYTESAKLEVSPTPDTVIRVFMAWKSSDEYIEIPEQILSAPEREGFTVIEWGGSEIQ